MAGKRDFSNIGTDLLTSKAAKSDMPSSLSDLMGIESSVVNTEKANVSQAQNDHNEKQVVKKADITIRECISISKSDVDIVNDLAVKCAAEGQKTTKADIYRASIRHFSKLSPSAMASKVREVRKDKKTHN